MLFSFDFWIKDLEWTGWLMLTNEMGWDFIYEKCNINVAASLYDLVAA